MTPKSAGLRPTWFLAFRIGGRAGIVTDLDQLPQLLIVKRSQFKSMGAPNIAYLSTLGIFKVSLQDRNLSYWTVRLFTVLWLSNLYPTSWRAEI